jgi:hypothetical protein
MPQAGMTENAFSKAQWLLFADESLKLAQAAETLAKREASDPVSAK